MYALRVDTARVFVQFFQQIVIIYEIVRCHLAKHSLSNVYRFILNAIKKNLRAI